jgi:arylsulfatase A-like enzyme
MAERFVAGASRGRRPFFLSVDALAPHEESVTAGVGNGPNPRPAPRDAGAFAGRPLPRPPSFNERNVSDKPGFVRKRPRLDAAAVAHVTALYRARLGSLLAVDRLVKGIAAELRRHGELESTIIIFTSDNGYMLGQHRLVGKLLPYEESSRVPFVIAGPGVPAGAVRTQLAANIDVAPTILAATGARPGLTMDGRSLWPAIRHPGATVHRALLIEEPEVHPYSAIRTARYVYVDYRSDRDELYDLRRDPYELRNVEGTPRYAAIEGRLQRRLAALRDCSGTACG